MRLKKLMDLYSSAKAIEEAFDGLSGSFFEQLDDYSLWTDLEKNVKAQTEKQAKILEDAIFTLFLATVCTAKKLGLDNAKEFFDFVFAFPAVAHRNRQQLSSLLRDLKTRQKNNLDDDLFKLSANDLQKLFKKVPAYDI